MKILFGTFLVCLYIKLVIAIPTGILGHVPMGMEVIDVMLIGVVLPLLVASIVWMLRTFTGRAYVR